MSRGIDWQTLDQGYSSVQGTLVTLALNCFQIIVCVCLGCCRGGVGERMALSQNGPSFCSIIVFSSSFHKKQGFSLKRSANQWWRLGMGLQGLPPLVCVLEEIKMQWVDLKFAWHTSEVGIPVGCLSVHRVGVSYYPQHAQSCKHLSESIPLNSELHSWTRAREAAICSSAYSKPNPGPA